MNNTPVRELTPVETTANAFMNLIGDIRVAKLEQNEVDARARRIIDENLNYETERCSKMYNEMYSIRKELEEENTLLKLQLKILTKYIVVNCNI